LKIFHRFALAGALVSSLPAAACTAIVPDRAAVAPSWIDERAAEATDSEPPVIIPEYGLDRGALIRVEATERRLMEIGAQVRDRADALSAETRDTEDLVRESLRRAAPPPAPGSR